MKDKVLFLFERAGIGGKEALKNFLGKYLSGMLDIVYIKISGL